MIPFSPSDLKTILHSKRANIYYLEHCRVLLNGGRVEYVTESSKAALYWNIPIANTTSVLLGPGTSVTQAAMRELAKAGVLVGFCGGGGTPLFNATDNTSIDDYEMPVNWFMPQSEYRPTNYFQSWVAQWYNPDKRLAAAKKLQSLRLGRVKQEWQKPLEEFNCSPHIERLLELIEKSLADIEKATDITSLLTAEGRFTKGLYKLTAQAVDYGDFTRAKRGSGTDAANHFLDHGNYLAYGLGATATWVLGLPHSMAMLHGKTRRGGLVFDAADLVKDSTVLPLAFVSAMRGDSDREFRSACIEKFTETEALDFIIDSLKNISLNESDV